MRNNYTGIDPKIVIQVRCSAIRTLRQLKGYMDIEDIEQELMLEVFIALTKYDQNRSKLSTYTARVLKNKVRHLIDKARAKKRHEVCLELKDDDVSIDPTIQVCLKIDLDRCPNLLPKKLALLFKHLETSNISEVARRYKTPNSTLHSKIRMLRTRLRRNGFD